MKHHLIASVAFVALFVCADGYAQAARALAVYAAVSESGAGIREVTTPSGQRVLIRSTPDLDERDVARVEYEKLGDVPAIKLVFTMAGTQRFQEVTRKHLGEQLVFVVRGKTVVAPRIDTVATESSIEITGLFTEKEVRAMITTIASALSRTAP